MGIIETIILQVRRADTPTYARIKRWARASTRVRLPLPLPWIWLIEAVHKTRSIVAFAWLRLCVMFYREPLFRRQCSLVGENLYLELLPSVTGQVRISIGDNVMISGALAIGCSRVLDHPELVIGDNVFIGHQVVLHPNKKIVIENGVLVANNCFITDSNEHPIDMQSRLRREPCPADELKPVTIRHGAWIGKGCTILRGVEIGEGAIVGAGSVVNKSVPPFTIVAGNPAQIVRELGPSGG